MAERSQIEQLETELGEKWAHLAQARALAEAKLQELASALSWFDSLDLSVVVFGSLARGELTPSSDPDWTLLVDGAADPNHLETSRRVKDAIEEGFKKRPGPEGTFGSMSPVASCFCSNLPLSGEGTPTIAS